jgi:hypothetical protein
MASLPIRVGPLTEIAFCAAATARAVRGVWKEIFQMAKHVDKIGVHARLLDWLQQSRANVAENEFRNVARRASQFRCVADITMAVWQRI